MTRRVLATGLSPGFWAALKRGRLMIPEEVLRPFIEEALAEEEEVRLRDCAFQTDGIRLEIEVEKAGTRLTLPMAITLDTISINRSEQKIEAHLAWGKPVGDNLLGRLVAGVAQGLIFRMAAGRMAGNQVATVAAMDRRHGRVIVDLSGLKPVRTFEHRLPVLGWSVLDLVSVSGVRHVDKGVVLQLAPPGGGT